MYAKATIYNLLADQNGITYKRDVPLVLDAGVVFLKLKFKDPVRNLVLRAEFSMKETRIKGLS